MHEHRTETLTVDATGTGTGASRTAREPVSPWARRLGRYGYRPSGHTPLRERLVPPMPDGPGVPTGAPSPVLARLGVRVPDGLWQFACRWAGWIGPLFITLFAGVLTFWKLGTPNAIIFDETYYAKDAWSIWHFGYERNWADNANTLIMQSPQHIPTPTGPEFIAHPPAGKWVIGLGEQIFGLNPFGWRFMVAVLGTLAVLMVCRIGRRLFRSTLLGCVAGLLLSVDGLHYVMSRTGLLDQMVMFWALCAFGLLLIDRDRSRARLADLVGATADNPDAPPDHARATAARLGWRPYRLLAGVCLGLDCATKWNGLWFVAFFGVMTVLWDAAARKTAGSRRPYLTALLHDAPWATFSMVVVALLTYVASWSGWLATSGGYDRNWAAGRKGLSPDSIGPLHNLPQFDMTWVPESLRSLWHYHSEIWDFNTNLHTPHTYMSNPWSWLVNARPVSFYYESPTLGKSGCTVAQCSSEVLGIGTPLLWWTATFALLYCLYRWFFRRDWRAAAICVGVAAGYLPWFQWQQRTIFLFYTIDFEPYLALAVALMIGAILGHARARGDRRLLGAIGAGVLILAIMANFLYFLPLYDAQVIPIDSWRARMWWPTWI
ncbi:dolichyl-phosphate-mannose--protein mannosyltransferase [Streptacidiphilus sp. MAP12-33]|uniref:dolichyl-phosphate-mannose--protein mannosyltransferase n=1 Tax=Streptacidiphilus sp. MAP12-33 TaxID=3156266 RepID=UPI0035116458